MTDITSSLLTTESLGHLPLKHPSSTITNFPVLNPCFAVAFSTSSSCCPQISLVRCATPCYAVNRKQIHDTTEAKITHECPDSLCITTQVSLF